MFNRFSNSLFKPEISLDNQMECIQADMLDDKCTNYLQFKLLVDHLAENKEKNKKLISYLYNLPIGKQVLTDAYLMSNLELLGTTCLGCSCYLTGATCTLGGCTGGVLVAKSTSLSCLPLLTSCAASSLLAFFGISLCLSVGIATWASLVEEPKFRKIGQYMVYIPSRLQANQSSEFHHIRLEDIVTYLKELSKVRMYEESTPLLQKSAYNAI